MKYTLILLLSCLFSGTIIAQEATTLRKKHFNTAGGLAIQGYDPVTYFRQGKAEKGNRELAVVLQGITYQFTSAENKEIFKKDPLKYEPQYGGWCAYAMGAKGEKVSVDPKTFKVLNGKLYLFYNKYFTNTLTDWNKDETRLRSQGDNAWNGLFK